MTSLNHIEVSDCVYFITAVTEDRKPWLTGAEDASIVLNALYFLRDRGDFKLYSFVIMPDHIHFLAWSAGKKTIASIMHSLKSFTAKAINKRNKRSGKIWQDNYYEHAVRNKADFDEKLNYIHRNPLEAGTVGRVEDYIFSSAHFADQTDPYPYW